MSDTEPDPDDELVSAYLDGEATPDERTTVEGRQELLARVEQLRGVAVEVSRVEGADPAQREAAIAAALGAFDGGAGRASGEPAGVDDLEAIRRRRRSRPAVVLGAAAAVVLTIAVGVAVLRPKSESTTTAALAAGAANPSTSSVQPKAGAPSPGAQNDFSGGATANGKSSASATAGEGFAGAPFIGDIGTFPDEATLARAVAPEIGPAASASRPLGAPTPDAAQPSTSPPLSRCDSLYRSSAPAIDRPVLTGEATVDGQPVLVIVYASGTDHRLVTFADDCSVVGTQPL